MASTSAAAGQRSLQEHRGARRRSARAGRSTRSMSIVPASAYATTSGGEAR